MKFLFFLFLSVFLYINIYANENFNLYKINGEEDGPTLLIFGGIHGNEPGGYFSASTIIQHYKIQKGNLWIVPNTNKNSIIKFTRGVNGDLNRKFSTISKNDKDKEIVKDIKKLIIEPEVNLVLNLHDGHGFFRETYKNTIFNPKAWGQTCVIDQIKLDQNSSFGNLACIAQKVSNKLNKHLLQNHHGFNVKNTQTKKNKNEMRHSLTYFSINHNKPSFAIETSKDLKTTAQKVYYQLRAIEAFMQIMGIKYQRDFDLDSQSIKNTIKNNKKLIINNNILLNLNNLRKNLRYFPLQLKNNDLNFSHPLGMAKENRRFIDLYIGHKKISRLHKAYFKIEKCENFFEAIVDGEKKSISLPSEVKIMSDIVINKKDGYRLNIIGFTDSKNKNEFGIKVTKKQLLKRFSLDNKKTKYRAEFYKDKAFCGMVILNFVD